MEVTDLFYGQEITLRPAEEVRKELLRKNYEDNYTKAYLRVLKRSEYEDGKVLRFRNFYDNYNGDDRIAVVGSPTLFFFWMFEESSISNIDIPSVEETEEIDFLMEDI